VKGADVSSGVEEPSVQNDEAAGPPATTTALTAYLNQIGRIPLLTPGEERRLAERVQRGDAAARRKMIEANLRLVVSIARRWQGNGVELPDLISAGNLGLIRAVELFDPARGCKLSTYATRWIEQRIRIAVAREGSLVAVPVHRHGELRAIARARVQLAANGETPTMERVAEATGLDVRTVADLTSASMTPASLDAPLSDDGSATRADLLEDGGQSVAERVADEDERRAVVAAIRRLPERERRIVEWRFGLHGKRQLTLEATAKRLGISRERVRQIERRALNRLGDNAVSALRSS
jgi:RNA polymerase primary sigma factor